MTKQHNMGRKSHHAQDAEYHTDIANSTQNELQDELGSQPTRPSVSPQQAKKDSREQPKRSK